jgi:inorganic phosphate transporter, PiT family
MWKVLSGVFLGWSLGANHSANVFGTGYATGLVKYRTAIWLTAVFAMAGGVLEGPKCMDVIGDLSRLTSMDAFFCALAGAITLTLLTILAIPASCSQVIVGAVLGAGILSSTADFSRLYKIVVCWAFNPIFAMFTAYVLHRILGYVINKTIISLTKRSLLYSAGIIIVGCYGAYTLGANNVANVTGVYVGPGVLSAEVAAVIGGLSIALGALTYSRKVMETVGKGIVPLDPFSALVAVLAEALSLHLFTQIGVPVSSSQAIVGALVGVGLVGDVQTVSVKMLARIGVGWIMTPVSGGVLAYLFIRLMT